MEAERLKGVTEFVNIYFSNSIIELISKDKRFRHDLQQNSR